MLKYRNAIVIGTMLVPTIGHLKLIEFASNIADSVDVLIQGRSFEPVYIDDRVRAVRQDVHHLLNVRVVGWNDDDAPQNPDPIKEVIPGADIEFWNHWKQSILSAVDVGPDDVIVASEPYGHVLAAYLGCHFVPFDLDRTLYKISGTEVREQPYYHWDKIAPAFRQNLKLNFVIFGQESVGKTTLARRAAMGHTMYKFVPEYARDYLEADFIGSNVTESKMRSIFVAQDAYENMIINDPNYRVAYFDTNILSTIGYFRYFMGTSPFLSMEQVRKIRSMIYILVPDDIPFEPDILRYGGDGRETSYHFWKDILDEFQCDYVEIPRGTSHRDLFIHDLTKSRMHDKIRAIKEFMRE